MILYGVRLDVIPQEKYSHVAACLLRDAGIHHLAMSAMWQQYKRDEKPKVFCHDYAEALELANVLRGITGVCVSVFVIEDGTVSYG